MKPANTLLALAFVAGMILAAAFAYVGAFSH